MRDAEEDKLKDTIRKYIRIWVGVLNLTNWDIQLYFEDPLPNQENFAKMADVSVKYEYFKATINVYLNDLWLERTDEEIEHHVVHELLHIVCDEFRDWDNSEKGQKREERVVESLAIAMIGLINARKLADKLEVILVAGDGI